MADYTSRVSERLYPLEWEPSDSMAVGTHNGTWVLMENYHRAWLVANVGDMQAGASLDIKLQEATANDGSGVQDITGKGATQLLQPSGHGDDLVCIELQTEEMDAANDYDYLRVQTYVGGAAVEYSYILYGCNPRFGPPPTANWHEVVG